jgi:hypothetical protein
VVFCYDIIASAKTKDKKLGTHEEYPISTTPIFQKQTVVTDQVLNGSQQQYIVDPEAFRLHTGHLHSCAIMIGNTDSTAVFQVD